MHKLESRTIAPGNPLQGEIVVPGDKSISHRAIMFASLAEGASRVRGLLRGKDCLATLHALQQLGVAVDDQGDDELVITGIGYDGLCEPQDVIDCGNSGTPTL